MLEYQIDAKRTRDEEEQRQERSKLTLTATLTPSITTTHATPYMLVQDKRRKGIPPRKSTP